MKVAVYGAGSVGGYLAARLAKAGREVAVIARGAHLAAIEANGLTLETPEERFTVAVQASDDPTRIGPVDLVLVTAKTTANPAVAAGIGPLLGPATPVAFAQNGVFWWYSQGFSPPVPASTTRLDPEGRLAAAIAPERRMGLVVHSPNEVVAPAWSGTARRRTASCSVPPTRRCRSTARPPRWTAPASPWSGRRTSAPPCGRSFWSTSRPARSRR
ncbi:MAG: 2-dehydropantoate 2-reductase N-terminal domain-containing protein [Geminicoccaceae bacterium]